MAEEKPHKPTAKKLRDARKKGQVAVSRDATSAVEFVVMLALLWMLGPYMYELIVGLWKDVTVVDVFRAPHLYLQNGLQHATTVVLWVVIGAGGLAIVGGVAGAYFQTGGLMAWSRIAPDMKHLNPMEGLKRIFSVTGLINLAKAVVKTLMLGALIFFTIRHYVGDALTVGHATAAGILTIASHLVLVICAWAAVIFAIMAVVDYTHQHYEFIKNLKMSTEELRKEHKEQEGDPQIRGRRRAAHREAIYASLGDRVKYASAVIQSSRVAIAIQYRGEKDLPRVIARGEGEVAAQIRKFAGEHLIPMEFDATLAEQIYGSVPLDRPIPRQLYGPVAKLLRWAHGMD